MKEFESWIDVLIFSAQDIIVQILNLIPKIFGAVLLFFIGYLIAKGVEKLVGKLLNLFGIDNISQKAGIDKFLISAGLAGNLSYLIARILFWTIMVLFLLPIADVLNFSFFGKIIDQIIGYLPNIFVAIFILLIGTWGAKVISGIVKGAASRIGIENTDMLSTLTNTLILLITFIIALTQLKIEASILTNILLIIIGSVSLAIAISFGIGSKDIFKNIIAGVYISKSINLGETMFYNNMEGRIKSIGTILTKIETVDGKEISVANNNLISEIIN